MSPQPSAHQQILSQHAALRARLSHVAELAHLLRRGESSVEELKSAVGLLVLAIGSHMDDEERFLAESVEAPWPPSRLRKLAKEHGIQRRLLLSFVEDATQTTRSDALARIALALVDELLEDMVSEEIELRRRAQSK